MQEEFLTLKEIELLSKEELVELEELSKSCPRCNGKSANPSNPSGRCRKHLNKLARDKKTPGHWQRSQTKFDDAKRRENGKNGTASKKSKGRASSRKDFVSRFQNDEKKTGTKLSPDRIKNERGYESKNVRNVPEKLNRGRHKVDPKKLAAWKKRLKKHGIELDDFMTLLRAKALQNGNETLEKTLNMLDIERLLSHLPFKETSEEKLQKADDEIEDLLKALKDEIGNTHTVEVHPDIDHMLRAKSFIKDSGRDAIHLSGFKKSGISPNMVDKLPRDGKGFVSPDMIDSHIASLPKKKIDVDILPYHRREQMHRDNPQYVLSMRMHPEEKAKMGMDKREEAAWDHMKQDQHSWDFGEGKNKNQIGWVRVDPHKNTPEGAVPHDHWHLDEIQSDFQNKKKIKSKLPYTIDEDIDRMLGHISHGHDDPQHLMHSVANALGRRLGVQSTSMDMPEDQAKKSNLSGYIDDNNTQNRQWVNAPRHRTAQGWNRLADDHIESVGIPEEHGAAVWGKHGQKLVDEHTAEDPDFKSAADKLGSDKLKEFAELAHNRTKGFMFNGEADDGWDQAHTTIGRGEDKISTELADKLKNMSNDERNALSQFMLKHSGNMQSHVAEMNGWGERPADDAPTGWWSDETTPQKERKKEPLPIHQINTYNKRPKKLGMEPVNKEDILGQHPDDTAKQIQYSKLHKKLEQINEILKKSK